MTVSRNIAGPQHPAKKSSKSTMPFKKFSHSHKLLAVIHWKPRSTVWHGNKLAGKINQRKSGHPLHARKSALLHFLFSCQEIAGVTMTWIGGLGARSGSLNSQGLWPSGHGMHLVILGSLSHPDAKVFKFDLRIICFVMFFLHLFCPARKASRWPCPHHPRLHEMNLKIL